MLRDTSHGLTVAFVWPCYSGNTSYLESKLPWELASVGCSVHLITSVLGPSRPAQGDSSSELQVAGDRSARRISCERGVWVHRLPHVTVLGQVVLIGLPRALRRVRPDIVQTGSTASPLSVACALLQPVLRYRLFTGAHQAARTAYLTRGLARRSSLLRLVATAPRYILGRLVSWRTERSYAVTKDARDVARTAYGVQRAKVALCPLGFDDRISHAVSEEERTTIRDALRTPLGIAPTEVVCVYSGRLTRDKNPMCLAAAVALLRAEKLPFRALFVGGGPEADRLEAVPGVSVVGYVTPEELSNYYHASDIAVWPQSYSVNQADAAACGLPLVVGGDSVKVELAPVSLAFQEGVATDLARVLRDLVDPERRRALGDKAARYMASHLTWRHIAELRLRDYVNASLGRPLSPSEWRPD